MWRKTLEILGFDKDDYSPYGIRRGGATWFFLETSSMDATLARGRWAASRTAKQYIDEGTLRLARLQWNSKQRTTVKKWSLKGTSLFLRLKSV